MRLGLQVLTDPGHAVEFAGLALKFIAAARQASRWAATPLLCRPLCFILKFLSPLYTKWSDRQVNDFTARG